MSFYYNFQFKNDKLCHSTIHTIRMNLSRILHSSLEILNFAEIFQSTSMGKRIDKHNSQQTQLTERPHINTQSLGEEVANAISHGTGALFAITGAIALIIVAIRQDRLIDIVSSSIYGGSLIFLYMTSTLYHSITSYQAKRIFRIFDHCAIFILILGCYAPLTLSLMDGMAGYLLFGWNIVLTVLGLVLNGISVKRFQTLSIVLYLLMGWSVVATFSFLPPLSHAAWALLVGGGLSYTIGIAFFYLKKPRFMHFIWHLFVLAGSVLHYFFVLFFVILL